MDNRFPVILNKVYPAREPISSFHPARLVSGWNTGLAKIMASFIRDFQVLTP
jgi:hypothetical protein